jgi:two-component system, OmpR family, response regulator
MFKGGFFMKKKLIYMADDEINICNIMKDFLTKEGFIVKTFLDGESLLEEFNKIKPDLVITDIMMPKMNGYTLCTSIRNQSHIPIIILSAKSSGPDKITGLSLGSDDYLTKPFSPMELVARVNSIFRRIDLDKSEKAEYIIQISDLTINPNTRAIESNGKNLGLTGMEFSLFYYLSANQNRAVSRNELLENIWGFETEVETRATDDMVKRIRKKLSVVGSKVKIVTLWGFGFKIE